MDRFPFLDLDVSLSRLLAAAFFVLVGGDVVACFKAIERNTRKS